jgi:hypothetical protein
MRNKTGSAAVAKAHAVLLASALALSWLHGTAAADPPRVAPEGPVWTAGGGFQFDSKPNKKRESLSGIACPALSAATPRLCVAVFDEGGEARYVAVDRDRITPQPEKIVLLPGDKELDGEGAARDGDIVYVTGSHSPKRGDCAVNLDGRHVFRFKVDGATGRAALDPTGKPVDLEDDGGKLWNLLKTNNVLGKFAGDGKCLGSPHHAVNIEGLAARSGVLYFGLREPAVDQTAYILTVRADALFGQGTANAEIYKFDVGKGRGIRDLLAVPEGVLMLLGPDDEKENNEPGKVSWRIAVWNGSGTQNQTIKLSPLAELDLRNVKPTPCDGGNKGDVKPEAVTMLESGSDFYRLLILSDGMCNGGPMSFKVQK